MREGTKIICDVLGAMSSAGLSIAANNDTSSFIAASSAPIISTGLNSLINGVFKEDSSEREFERLGISAKAVKNSYERNLKQGKTIVNSIFINSEIKGPNINDVLESILQSIKDDSETMKSEIYGRFLGNIPFRGDLDASNILFIKNIIHSLSFTELCILEIINRRNIPKLSNLQQMINSDNRPVLFEFYNALLKLKSNSLLLARGPVSLGDTIGNVEISKLGKYVCDVAELNQINADWLATTESILISISKSSV